MVIIFLILEDTTDPAVNCSLDITKYYLLLHRWPIAIFCRLRDCKKCLTKMSKVLSVKFYVHGPRLLVITNVALFLYGLDCICRTYT